MRGTLVLIVFFSFFKHGLIKNLQFQGWGCFQISEVSAGFGLCV